MLFHFSCLLIAAIAFEQPRPADLPQISGTDPVSGITYVLITTTGSRSAGKPEDPAPRLTAQCTRQADGKLRFELLTDDGSNGDLRFIPPFKSSTAQQYAPPVPHANVTMQFLGYTHVKPVKRQWSGIDGLRGEWIYATPGFSSANMEQITFYLQYLRALPTLRLTFPKADAGPPLVLEFETTRWLARIRAEPLCAASGIPPQ